MLHATLARHVHPCVSFWQPRVASDMRYLTFPELRAKLGGRSRSSIYNDLAAKRLPQPVKLGGRLYWPEADLDDHLRALRDEQAV